jgi:hypothetical protein
MYGVVVAKRAAIVGVSDHAGWAVLVTATPDGALVDRRRITLIDRGLPALPHHHEAQALPAEAGIALVERVRASARRHARAALETLAGEVAVAIRGIALRECPELPPTVAERITNYRAQCVADSVMYRDVLADAAGARDWPVSWYEVKRVFDDAERALGKRSIADLLRDTGKALGPPWQKDHRLAMAAAIAAAKRA